MSDLNNTHSGDINHDVRNINGTLNGNIFGNVLGSIFGIVNGNIFGFVAGDVNGFVNGDIYGSIYGNVNGTIRGDVNGDINGDIVGRLSGSVFSVKGSIKGIHGGEIKKNNAQIIRNNRTNRSDIQVSTSHNSNTNLNYNQMFSNFASNLNLLNGFPYGIAYQSSETQGDNTNKKIETNQILITNINKENQTKNKENQKKNEETCCPICLVLNFKLKFNNFKF